MLTRGSFNRSAMSVILGCWGVIIGPSWQRLGSSSRGIRRRWRWRSGRAVDAVFFDQEKGMVFITYSLILRAITFSKTYLLRGYHLSFSGYASAGGSAPGTI